jgi:hypothetical protein
VSSAAGAPAPGDRAREIGAALVAEAERLDWLAAWPLVVGARAALLEAVAGLSAEQAAWKPGDVEPEGEWSAEQVVRHALNSSRDVLRVIEELAAGEPARRRTRPGEQPADAPASFDALRRELIAHSVDFASLPARLPAKPNGALTAPHARFGELNCRAWFLFQRLHDGDHTAQIARIQATAGFPAA